VECTFKLKSIIMSIKEKQGTKIKRLKYDRNRINENWFMLKLNVVNFITD